MKTLAFRFTIRDLLWLTVVVGIGLAWFFAARRAELREARLQYAERQVRELGGLKEDLAKEKELFLGTLAAVKAALNEVGLTEEQRASFGQSFTDELKRQGVEIQSQE